MWSDRATASSHWFVSFLFRLPGNIKLGSNPTFYRSPNEYFSLLQKEIGSCVSDDGENHHHNVFELSRANSVSAYVKVKINLLYVVSSFLVFSGFPLSFEQLNFGNFQLFLLPRSVLIPPQAARILKYETCLLRIQCPVALTTPQNPSRRRKSM